MYVRKQIMVFRTGSGSGSGERERDLDLDLDLDLLYFRAHKKERLKGALTYNEMQVIGSRVDR